jgi:hypothetical protein
MAEVLASSRTLCSRRGNQREDWTMWKYLLAASLVGALLSIIALATSGQNCQVSSDDTARVVPDAVAGNGIPERPATHCLIYGKLCLGNTLRGR